MISFLLLGFRLTEGQLKEVAELSGVLEVDHGYLEDDFREKCDLIIPYPEQVKNDEWFDSYIFLKSEFIARGY